MIPITVPVRGSDGPSRSQVSAGAQAARWSTGRSGAILTSVPLPVFSPMLMSVGSPARDRGSWIFEAKWDGWRALAYIDQGLKVRTRSGRQVSDSLPELAGLVDALGARPAILDGELIACQDGAVDSRSRRAWRRSRPTRRASSPR
jgi:ATP-dependent DNA ligase